MSYPGVTFLDHTADVGMDVEAASLEALLHRAAIGMLALIRGEEEDDDAASDAASEAGSDAASEAGSEAGSAASGAPDAAAATPLTVAADSGPTFLAAWLREILFLHEVERRDYAALTAHVLGPWSFGGVVWTRPAGRAVREIKGVTYHALTLEERDGRWRARVIFDV